MGLLVLKIVLWFFENGLADFLGTFWRLVSHCSSDGAPCKHWPIATTACEAAARVRHSHGTWAYVAAGRSRVTGLSPTNVATGSCSSVSSRYRRCLVPVLNSAGCRPLHSHGTRTDAPARAYVHCHSPTLVQIGPPNPARGGGKHAHEITGPCTKWARRRKDRLQTHADGGGVEMARDKAAYLGLGQQGLRQSHLNSRRKPPCSSSNADSSRVQEENKAVFATTPGKERNNS